MKSAFSKTIMVLLFGCLLTGQIYSQAQLSEENKQALIRSLESDPFYNYQSSNTSGIGGLLAVVSRNFQYADDSELNTAYIKYLSGRLAVLGFNAGNIQSLKNSGIDVIKSATTFPTSVTDRAILSEMVIRGRVKSIINDPSLGDGYNTTIEIEPVAIYKRASNVDEVFLRIKTGFNSNGDYEYLSSDISARVGDEFIFFLSSTFYDVLNTGSRGNSNKNIFVETDGGFQLHDGKYVATLPGSEAAYDLSEIEKLIQNGIK